MDGYFIPAHGTLLMMMYHGNYVILGCESRLRHNKTNKIEVILKVRDSDCPEAVVSEKAVVNPYFVGVSAGPMRSKSVFHDLEKTLSSSQIKETKYMGGISNSIMQAYNNLIEKDKEVVPSRLFIIAIDEDDQLAIHYFSGNKNRTECDRRKIERAERYKCCGQESDIAREVLDKGYSVAKNPSDMVELMYEAMNIIFAKNKLMGGEFHAYIISIEKVDGVSRLKTTRQNLKTILGNKRKRGAEKNPDEVAYAKLSRQLKME